MEIKDFSNEIIWIKLYNIEGVEKIGSVKDYKNKSFWIF